MRLEIRRNNLMRCATALGEIIIMLHFIPEMVHSRIDSHEFVVCEKSSSTVTTQKAAHIFPLKPEFKIKKKQKLDYVLAPSDESCELYLPAKVSKGSRTGNGSTRTVTFHFYNGLK